MNPTWWQSGQMAADVAAAHQHGKKALLSVGGAGVTTWEGACTSTYRAAFANNLVALMKQYGYDGLDLDIEDDPANLPGWSPTYTDLTACVSGIRSATKAYNPNSILTNDTDNTWQWDEAPYIAPYVDYVQFMSYWQTASTVATEIPNFTGAGIPIGKLVVGLGTDPTDPTQVDIGSSADVLAKTQLALNDGMGGLMNWCIVGQTTGTDTVAKYVSSTPSPSPSPSPTPSPSGSVTPTPTPAPTPTPTPTPAPTPAASAGTAQVVQSRSGIAYTSNTVTASLSNVKAGDLLVVGLGVAGGWPYSVGGVTDSQGDAFAVLASGVNGDNTVAAIYVATAKSSGSDTVTVKAAGSGFVQTAMTVVELAGVTHANGGYATASSGTAHSAGPVPSGAITVGVYADGGYVANISSSGAQLGTDYQSNQTQIEFDAATAAGFATSASTYAEVAAASFN